MFYKCTAALVASIITEGRNEEEARAKAEPILRLKLRDPATIKSLDPKIIKTEPYAFSNAKIILSGGPLSVQY